MNTLIAGCERFVLMVALTSCLFSQGVAMEEAHVGTPCASRAHERISPPLTPHQSDDGLAASDWQGIRDAHNAWRHRFREVDGAWLASNPGQRWTTNFDGRGFLAKPQGASWEWGLELRSYGFEGGLHAVGGRAEIVASGQRLSYHWPCGLEEWFLNDHRGLEHGFVVSRRPSGGAQDGRLVFTMNTLGGLDPMVSGDAQTVHFRDQAESVVLHYSGLKVWDADGRILTSRFESGSDGEFRIVVDEAQARYPIIVDPIAQQAYLKASNSGAADSFGRSIAISANTVVVGAPYEDSNATGVDGNQADDGAANSGAAYVFVRSGSTWTQQAYLKASNTNSEDGFAWSVAICGDTVVIGAPYEDSNATGVDGNQSNNSATDAGAAYVFTRTGGTWSQQAYLKASNSGANDYFGWSVAVSEHTVAVGAHDEDSAALGVNGVSELNSVNSGAAYVFIRSETTWSQQAYIKSPAPADAFENGGDHLGWDVAVDGDTLVVSATGEESTTTGINTIPNEAGEQIGALYVYVRSSGAWSHQAYLKASTQTSEFGHSVAISGETIVAGALADDAGAGGAAFVFTRNGTIWSQQARLHALNEGFDDKFGDSVSVCGDNVVIGAPDEDSNATGIDGNASNNSTSNSGAAYLFIRSGTTWTQQAYLKSSNSSVRDYFGRSVAISENTVVVGAIGEGSNATGVNGDQADRSADDAGAAYIFTGFGAGGAEISVEQTEDSDIADGGSASFGNAALGQSRSLAFTIANIGDADLTGLTIAMDGAHAADYTVTPHPTAPVAPGGSTVFSVQFTPSDTGTRTAAIRISSNDADEAPFDINLSGTGLANADDDVASDAWETANGFSPSVTGDVQTLDSDGDGVKDIYEIFQGTDRYESGSSYGLKNTEATVDESTRELTTRYRRSTTQTAVAHVLQWSEDLSSGFTSNASHGGTGVEFNETVIGSGAGYEIVEVTLSVVSGSPTRMFFNLGLQPVE